MAISNYTFSSNVPLSTQKISATQQPILSNFQAVADLINQNHVGFSDSTNYGKHNYTSLPVQSLDPVTNAGEMAVYSKSTPSGPNSAEIFYRYPSNGAIVQLTGGISGAGASTQGYAFMSSTVFMMWGTATGIVNGSNIIIFSTTAGFPTFGSTPYQLYFTAQGNYSNLTTTSPYITSVTTTQFTFQVNAIGYATSIYWLAIGSI